MTQREEKEEAEKREKELHREKIKSLIQLDEEYEETVPFPDYSSDEDEVSAQMKGVPLSGYMGGYRKSLAKRRITDEDVRIAIAVQSTCKPVTDKNELISESLAIRTRAKKIIDQNKDRSNKLF